MSSPEVPREEGSDSFNDSVLCGRVMRATRERFTLWTSEGEIEVSLSGHFRHTNLTWPCVGDWVQWGGAAIRAVLPRRTLLYRKAPGKTSQDQLLAANIDVVFVVSGLDGDYSGRRLERYLLLVFESGARPVILLNKADLVTEIDRLIGQTQRYAPGVEVFAVSGLRKLGLDVIPRAVKTGETAALIGSSGAGKSTIVNWLLGEQRQEIASVRESDSRGRHTTTARELFLMPGGWWLMDSPGLREIQLPPASGHFQTAFSEIADLAQSCRFRDCTHTAEPGCAVQNAELAPGRLESYHKLQREMAFNERQADARLERETRKKWRALEREMRKHPKRT